MKTKTDGTKRAPAASMDRATVQGLPERDKNRLRAEAFALVAKGQAATGTEALVLSERDRARLAELLRCGMLPSDAPAAKPITPERNAALRDLARQRNEASRPDPEAHALAVKIQKAGGRDKANKKDVRRFDELEIPGTGGRSVPAFLESEAEAERVRALQSELTAGALGVANDALAARNDTLTDGHRRLAAALANWVALQLKEAAIELTDDEARLFALLITPHGTTEDGATKYMPQRAIAAELGVSAMAVKRREDKLRRDHRTLRDWLDDKGVTRKPRGSRKPTVTNRKKSA